MVSYDWSMRHDIAVKSQYDNTFVYTKNIVMMSNSLLCKWYMQSCVEYFITMHKQHLIRGMYYNILWLINIYLLLESESWPSSWFKNVFSCMNALPTIVDARVNYDLGILLTLLKYNLNGLKPS